MIELVILYVLPLFVLPGVLWAWGRHVARRHGNARGWRIASRLPLAALGIPFLLFPAQIFWAVFRGFLGMSAAERATALAREVSNAVNATGVVCGLAILLHVGCAIAFAYGHESAPMSER